MDRRRTPTRAMTMALAFGGVLPLGCRFPFDTGPPKTTTTQVPLGSGDTLFIESTFRPSFSKGVITYRYYIRWRTGAREELPSAGVFPDQDYRVLEAGNSVLIVSRRYVFARGGSLDTPHGRWVSRQLTSSQDLYRFIREFARQNDDGRVVITTRPAHQRVDGDAATGSTDNETEEMLNIPGTHYYIRSLQYPGCFLPYQIDHVDARTLDVVWRRHKPLPYLPPWLVFSHFDLLPGQKPESIHGNWRFDQTKTEEYKSRMMASTIAPSRHVRIDTDLGAIILELALEKAPDTAENFLRYVDDGFYDGTTIHRAISNFVIQGGGYEPGLREKTARAPITNESNNGLKNMRGTIAMARASPPNSATSQFFINVVDNAFLDYPRPDRSGYCVFGKVIEGMDVVDKIRRVPTHRAGGMDDVPVQDVIVRSVRRH